jgi:predicted phosphodiesterase
MRVALISDIHGNEVALRAALDSIGRAGVDRIVCLGDVATLGPRPAAVLSMLSEIGCPCIVGNHDAFMLEPELVHGYAQVPIVVEAVDWTRSQLSAGDLEMVRGFVPSIEIPLSAEATLFLFHGTPRSHMEDLLATTPPDDLDRMLDGHHAAVMAGGHTHVQMLRQHRGLLLVNPGSVGLPFREYVGGRSPTLMPGHAEYAIVEARGGELSVTLHRAPVDRSALRRSLEGSDNPLTGMLRQQYG